MVVHGRVAHVIAARAAVMLAVLTTLASLGCAIEDGTAFGAPYTVAATPNPTIGTDGHISFTATYASTCADEEDGVSFEVTRFAEGSAEKHENAPAILRESIMLVAARSEPATCRAPRPFPVDVTVDVHAPVSCSAELLTGARSVFFACPPGSTFEMMKVDMPQDASRPAFLGKSTMAVPVPAVQPADWDEEEDGEWQPSPHAAGADGIAAPNASEQVEEPGAARAEALAATASSAGGGVTAAGVSAL